MKGGEGSAANLPGPHDLDGSDLRDDDERLRNRLALDVTLAVGARPPAMPTTAFDEVHGFLDAVAVCASDGLRFDPDAMLQRRATTWADTRECSPESYVVEFVRAYAAPIDEHDALEACLEHDLRRRRRAWSDERHDTRTDGRHDDPRRGGRCSERQGERRTELQGGRRAERGDRRRTEEHAGDVRALADALEPDALQATARRLCGPATWLRAARGYHGRVQPSPFLTSPRDGATAVRAKLEALAAWVADAAVSPAIVAAVVFAWLVALHPFRDGNLRVASVMADRALRGVPGGASARFGLGGVLAERRPQVDRRIAEAVFDGDWDGWCRTFLRAVEAATVVGAERRRAYRSAFSALVAHLGQNDGPGSLARKHVTAERIAATAARSPYLGVATLQDAGLARRVTAARYLDALLRAGVAVPAGIGRFRLVRVSTLADALSVEPPPRGRRAGLDRMVTSARSFRTIDPHDP